MFACLRQSTAATIKLGPFVDATDGATAKTGLTISQADIRISKGGGDFAQSNNSAGATHDENGYYDVPLDTTDTSVLGRLRVTVHESGARPVYQDFMVVPEQVFDSLFGSDKLQVQLGDVPHGGTNATLSLGNVIVDDIVAVSGAVMLFSGLNAGTLTGNLDGNVTGSVGSLGTQAKADVNAEVDTAIETYHLDHLLAATYDPANKPGVGDALLNEIVENDGGVSRFTANALEQAAATHVTLADSSLTAAKTDSTFLAEIQAECADALVEKHLDQLLYNGLNFGTVHMECAFAQLMAKTTEGGLSGYERETDSLEAIRDNLQTAAAAALTAYDPPTKAELDSGLDALPTAAEIRAEVDSNSTQLAAIVADTNELQTDWANGGRLDNILDARASQTSVDTLLKSFVLASNASVGASGNDATHVNLGALTYGNEELKDHLLVLRDDSDGMYYSRWIEDWNTTTKLATVATLPFTPVTSDDKYWLLALRRSLNSTQAEAAANAAIVANHLDHLLAATYDPANKPGAADALLNEIIDNDGSGVSQFTENALGQTPASIVTDWTSDERAAIRAILGVPGSGTTPADPSAGILDTIRDNAVAVKAKTDNLPSDPASASTIATSLSTVAGYVDTEVAAIKAKTDLIPASPAAVGSAMTLTNAYDVYHADIDIAIDGLDSLDEYTVTWFKNGARVTGTISTPKIQVIKRDGTDLVSEIAADPGAVGAGVVVHDENTGRLEPGEAVAVVVSAFIDSATRTFSKVVSRDSIA